MNTANILSLYQTDKDTENHQGLHKQINMDEYREEMIMDAYSNAVINASRIIQDFASTYLFRFFSK
jgi:hypothetical protein